MQDTTLLLIGSVVAFVVVLVIYYWVKVVKPRQTDRAFDEFGAIVGTVGKNRGFQRAQVTGIPQLLVEMEETAQLTSLIVQYGHKGTSLGTNRKTLNVAGYHRKEGLNTEFFLRPAKKPSPIAYKRDAPVRTGNGAFDTAITVDYATQNGLLLLQNPQIQNIFLEIPNLVFFEIRPEGVRTLLWGEIKGVSERNFTRLYNTINAIASTL